MACMMIKPVSGSCGMKCAYCFYRDEMSHRTEGNLGFMSAETANLLIDRLANLNDRRHSFVFQGGEPTLAGIDFFRNFLETAEKKLPEKTLSWAIQTNGCNITEEWAKFFFEKKFLVGLSVDGVEKTHDKYRLGCDGKGTFSKAIAAAKTLSKAKVDFNILTVVTKDVASIPEEIYDFYKKSGFTYWQYIPCLDGLGRGEKAEYSITPELYLSFLKRLFDCYKRDMFAGNYVYIRRFENLCGMTAGLASEECGLSGECNHGLLIEADGGIYPCDFYALDEYRLGNVKSCELSEAFMSPAMQRFQRESLLKPKECDGCRWKKMCGGGCRRDRVMTENGVKNVYCETFRAFLDYAYEDMKKIVGLWRR